MGLEGDEQEALYAAIEFKVVVSIVRLDSSWLLAYMEAICRRSGRACGGTLTLDLGQITYLKRNATHSIRL